MSKNTNLLEYTNIILSSKYSLAASLEPIGLRRGMNIGYFTANIQPSSPLHISIYFTFIKESSLDLNRVQDSSWINNRFSNTYNHFIYFI